MEFLKTLFASLNVTASQYSDFLKILVVILTDALLILYEIRQHFEDLHNSVNQYFPK